MNTIKTPIILFAIFSAIIFISCNSSSTNNTSTDNIEQTAVTAAQAKTLAKEAYLFGLPVVFIEKQSDYQTHTTRVEKRKAPVNQFLHYRAFVDASDRSVV